MQQLHQSSVDRLFETIAGLKSMEECYLFFEDLCTAKEILGMAQRLETARLLDRGMAYAAISGQTGISSATISRVSRCLQFGSGGYRLALDRGREAADAEQTP